MLTTKEEKYGKPGNEILHPVATGFLGGKRRIAYIANPPEYLYGEHADPRFKALLKEKQDKYKPGDFAMEIPLANCTVVPKLSGRECIFVCGPSGSGKSVWTNQYIKDFNRVFNKGLPKDDEKRRKIFFFSRLDDDVSITCKSIQRIDLNDLETDPIYTDDIPENSLCVFDDCDTFTDRGVVKEIKKLQHDLLETGRHRNIYVVILSHLLIRPSREENSYMYNECHLLTIFTNAGNNQHKKGILDRHFGMNAKEVREILTSKSHWVTICKQYPNYYVTEKGVKLLSHDI